MRWETPAQMDEGGEETATDDWMHKRGGWWRIHDEMKTERQPVKDIDAADLSLSAWQLHSGLYLRLNYVTEQHKQS